MRHRRLTETVTAIDIGDGGVATPGYRRRRLRQRRAPRPPRVRYRRQGTDLTFHMITHSRQRSLLVRWSIAVWTPRVNLTAVVDTMVSSTIPVCRCQLIEQAVAEGSDGIASALASLDQLIPPLQAAVAGGIPVITLNSARSWYLDIGALVIVG